MSQINVNLIEPSSGPSVTVGANLIVSGTTNVRPYKVYTALLAQNGPPNYEPTAEVLENTLGATITWTRNAVGEYFGTASAPVFTAFKTAVFMQVSSGGGATYPIQIITSRSSNTQVFVITELTDSVSTKVDGRLGLNPIEIRVYQ